MMLSNTTRWSHPPGNAVVPSPWQATVWPASFHVTGAKLSTPAVLAWLTIGL